jgi:hypothetical protein
MLTITSVLFRLISLSGPGIGENAPLPSVWQKYRQTRTRGGRSRDPREIHNGGTQPVERDLAERVFAQPCNESDLRSQDGQIVGGDGRRTAQRDHQTAGQQFLLEREFLRQTIEDDVKVEFAGDRDVELWYGIFPREFRRE